MYSPCSKSGWKLPILASHHLWLDSSPSLPGHLRSRCKSWTWKDGGPKRCEMFGSAAWLWRLASSHQKDLMDICTYIIIYIYIYLHNISDTILNIYFTYRHVYTYVYIYIYIYSFIYFYLFVLTYMIKGDVFCFFYREFLLVYVYSMGYEWF